MTLVVPALLALVALGAAAQACLLCFTSYSQRLRICHMFTGRLGPEQEKCEEAFTAAFKGLLDVEFGEDAGPWGHRRPGERGAGAGDEETHRKERLRTAEELPAQKPSSRESRRRETQRERGGQTWRGEGWKMGPRAVGGADQRASRGQTWWGGGGRPRERERGRGRDLDRDPQGNRGPQENEN